MCQAVEQGGTAAPDVSATAQSAAASLVEWVKVRNRALGEPEMSAPVTESIRKQIVQNLVDVSVESWKANRSSDQKKRAAAAAALKDRLRWKAYEDIR